MAWISTLLCISAPYTLITMTFRAACSFSFSTHSLWSGKSKSPTRWWATRPRRAFHMVNSFRWVRHCPAIIKHLLYGMEKMHCHCAALKEPLKDGQGFSLLPGLWPWHKPVGGGPATCIRLWRRGWEGWGEKNKRGQEMKRGCAREAASGGNML